MLPIEMNLAMMMLLLCVLLVVESILLLIAADSDTSFVDAAAALRALGRRIYSAA